MEVAVPLRLRLHLCVSQTRIKNTEMCALETRRNPGNALAGPLTVNGTPSEGSKRVFPWYRRTKNVRGGNGRRSATGKVLERRNA